MGTQTIHAIFESLTEKQHETLRLAANHFTSKQIALELGVAPVTIDKRIEAVRSKLDLMPRVDLLRHYRTWSDSYGQPINDLIILPDTTASAPEAGLQAAEQGMRFNDSLTFDVRAPWDHSGTAILPRIKPSDLSMGGKLLFMLGGAIAILVIAILSIAFANAVATMV
ncbi:helix-turn-helix domain-containing protein [Croceicoccus mobilis]|uniref:HTH luxR-type domain-containing protein n=1 Tax=Croceicoccus mobilis TaxID=1703339 RepID=A0A916YR89_9SPHN|nr:helix-turn-helix transcriptional regulator [Croceicoccus mobilis]GGD57122.1 hypothetical protein GCM10010990_02940 [Croceicoccus mobilis]